MKVLITRANPRGEFDTVGITNRLLLSDVASEADALTAAKSYARGLAFRVELYHDERFYNSQPFRVLTQYALELWAHV
jgi:hypothetical protein